MKGGWAAAHMRSHPPSRVIARQRMRCQSDRKDSPTLEERAPRSGQARVKLSGLFVNLYHTISDEINAALLQYTPNLLSILHTHASNADAALELAVKMLNNFELKRDTVQAKNDLPAQ